ncbi:MAG: DUF4388 domain-containing protein [Rhodocyclales bacterium]|nr:DUF4388 domain-containing protein [Rhodocyclales bacterium]
MAQAEWTPFPQIVEHIRQLCAQRRTGTLFLVSDDNLMAQVQLERGDIVSLMHRNRRGLDALAILGKMKNAKLRFDDAFVTPSERQNLPTQAIFDYLTGATPKIAQPVVASGSSASDVVTAEVRATMQKILMKYVGPMAEIICADHFERATDVRTLARSLADEIPDQAEAEKFAVEIAKALNLTPV